ncbi:hypothetical protein TRVA0_019S01640 [Trichomonascus vanleenenianus]|uniref:GTPase-activating protein BEM2 n=1 Tax=Trichomonascus vanleenenianus TaxID=2268995 RepID=UPI003ECAE114
MSTTSTSNGLHNQSKTSFHSPSSSNVSESNEPRSARAIAESMNISRDGWVNRHASSANALSTVNPNTPLPPPSWRLTRLSLRDGVLSMYKPPAELNIRSFDPTLLTPPPSATSYGHPPTPSSANSSSIYNTMPSSSSMSINTSSSYSNTSHKRIMSSNSLVSPLLAPARDSSTTSLRIQYRGLDPHPDLDYDGRGRIIGGTDEAICHTILFGESDEFAKTAVLLMPLLSDIVVAFELLTEFASSALGARSGIGSEGKSAVIARLQLVVETVKVNFPGMFLDTTIFAGLCHLLETISAHNDPVGNELKRSVFQKQKAMTDILAYETHQEPVLWSVQPKITAHMSERLRAFLNRVEVYNSPNPSSNNDGTFGGNSRSNGSNGNSATSNTAGSITEHRTQPRVTTVPPELFLELETKMMSSQIYYFHLAFSRDWSPTSDTSLLFNTKYNYQRHSPLVFDSTNIHFLGSLLLDHLFGGHRKVDSPYRGKLITHWINLGNELKSCGDMVGWLAVATVLCSIPVMRLREAWSFVSVELRDRVVKEWAPVVFDLERRSLIADMSRKSTYHVLAPQGIGQSYPKERVVPFFGDLCVKYEEGATFKHCENRLNRIRLAFNRWFTYLDQIPQNDTFDNPPEPVPSLQKLLYGLLAHHFETPVLTPESVLRMSLAAEPSTTGYYLKHHYTTKSPLSNGSYLPLIFTDVNHSYKLFSQQALIAASGAQTHNHHNPKRSIRGSSNSSSRNDSRGEFGGSLTNLSSIRQGSTGGYSVSSSASSNSSTISLQNANSNGSNSNINGNLQRSNSFPPSANQQFAMTTGVKDVDLSSRQFVSRYSSRHALMKNIRDVLNVGAKLYYVGEELVLKSFADEDASRPSSMIETPSKRHSATSRRVSAQLAGPQSPRGTTPGSMNDYASLANAYERFNNIISVVVRSASLERLFDVLVLGANEFSPYLICLDGGNRTKPQLQIDMDVNTLTFFATFRSFCSPNDLLDGLRRRFVGARSAAVSIVQARTNPEMTLAKRTTNPEMARRGSAATETSVDGDGLTCGMEFPCWYPDCEEAPEEIDWKIVAQIQVGVLEACHLWISQYFGDFVNDLSVRDQFLDFLKALEGELVIWEEAASLKEEYLTYSKTIETLHKKVRKLFIKKSYRPNDIKLQLPKFPLGTRMENLMVGGTASLLRTEKFIEDINLIASEYFSLIHLNDWMELFEVLETQSADMLGFFNYKPPPQTSHDDDVIVQDIFTYLGTLYRDGNPEDVVVNHMPQAVKELLKFHSNVVNFLTFQISEPTLHKDDRVGRIVTVLKGLGLIRKRMRNIDLASSGSDDGSNVSTPSSLEPTDPLSSAGSSPTTVPAFLESAFTAAILRPESRYYANAWLQAGREISRHYSSGVFINNMTSIDPFIPEIPSEQLKLEASKKALTPCIGWIIERMLEIVCYVPNMSIENPALINFDKRRYVYNLVTNISDIKVAIDGDDIANIVGGAENAFARYKSLAYLINPDKNMYVLDRRAIRDAASKEAKEYPKANAKARVFMSYVTQESEKQKRDVRQHEVLDRQMREMRKNASRNNKGVGHTGSLSSEKKGRSRFGGFLKAVRPISMALSGSFNAAPSDKVVSLGELPDLISVGDHTRTKLLMAIDLANSEVGMVKGRSPNMWKIHVNNASYLFQSQSEADAEEWTQALARARKYAVYLSQTSSTSTKVFGVPVGVVCEREGRDIPKAVEILLSEVEARGLTEVGLYRIPGSLASVNALKSALDSGSNIDMEDERWYDINTVAGCFKLYLRELPEPLLTNDLFNKFVNCGTGNDEASILRLRECVKKLPRANLNLLKRLIEHLVLVTINGEKNRMHAVNLAIVFSMSFLPMGSAASSVSSDLGAMQNILKAMIVYYNQIFCGEPFESPDQQPPSPPLQPPPRSAERKRNTQVTAEQQQESANGPSDSESTGNSSTQLKRDSITEVSAY